MPKSYRSAIFQGVLFVMATLVAFALLVRTDLVRRLAYLVEKGRLEAQREALPDDDELARLNADARTVAAVVTPAVVQIITEKQINMAALLGQRRKPDQSVPDISVPSNGLPSGHPSPAEVDRFLRQHEQFRAPDGYGSGFIVDAEHGYIVTNDHVIAGADTIYVRLADGRIAKAEVLGADPRSDLAAIHIDVDNLHQLPIAEDDGVEVGDPVMSVGNPFGLEGSVSRGIISAKARSNINIHGTEYRGFLQTDAVINPGNSGGPLVNLRGEVVAINTAIATETGHYDGVGFAIPARRIRQVLPALIRGETVPRGFLGVTIADAAVEGSERVTGDDMFVDPALRENRGVLVRDVMEDSPAERFGVLVGDVIVSIDGTRLRQTADLIDIVGDSSPGATIALAVERNGEPMTIDVTIGRQPEGFSTRQPIDN
ncbi:MAG: trypsin-like peptidase domain-containing protein [Phycisphaerales bacterium]|nr:trypsin-like peptidase domain-containing protein [Phycisphaerales bacterium]